MSHRAFRSLLAVLVLTLCARTAGAQGSVGGTVRAATGEPIKGATVTARNPEMQPDSFTVSTDEKGRFAMIGLPRGDWTFYVQAPGYVPDSTAVTIRAIRTNAPVGFTLTKAPVVPSVLGSLDAKDLQGQLASADALYKNQKWDDAITAYRAILAKAPALSYINLQIGAAYRNKKAYDGAIAAYSDILKNDPNNVRAKVGIAMANMEKGDLDTAERTLDAAAQSASQSSASRDVFYSLGEVKTAKAKPDEALQAYQRAAQADPTWGKPVYALGRAAMSRDDKAAALKYFEKVVEIDPTSPEASQAKTAIAQLKP